MIAKGNTHGNGGKLASYMVAGKADEKAELYQLRGFDGLGLKDAFRVVTALAEATRCEKPFLHVQVRNPEGEHLSRAEWEKVADRIESKLGYTGQPRAIAFHTDQKSGHEHMHVAFSRIDEDSLTAKPLPFFKLRLKEVCRELEADLGLTPVRNDRDRPDIRPPTRDEWEESRRLKVDTDAVRADIRDAFDGADSGKAFAAALREKDLTLCQGERRDYVVIDHAGGMHALGKRLLGVSAAETRGRLADIERAGLPTVDEARQRLPERQPAQLVPEPRPPERPEPAVRPAPVITLAEQRLHERVEAAESRRQERAAELLKRADVQDLRAAWRRADSPAAFVAKLEVRGYVVGRVDADEAAASREAAKSAAARDADRTPPVMAEGDIVAISPRGSPYKLDGAVLDDRNARAQLFTLDATPMLTLGQARDVARYFRETPQRKPEPRSSQREFGESLPALGVKGMEGLSNAAGGLLCGIGDFLFGGVGGKPAAHAPAAPPVAPLNVEGKKARRTMGMTRPEEAVADPNIKELVKTYTLGVRPELVEAMRRQIEQARERDDERDRER